MEERVVLVDGARVVITGPPGFCLDERLVDESRTGAVAFLSDCAAPAGEATIADVPLTAVLTASVSNSGLPDRARGMGPALDKLATFLETPFGQLTLSKSRNPALVRVLSIERRGAVVFAYVEDRGQTSRIGESPRFWRAFTEVGGRLVVLTATGLDAADPSQKRAERILVAFVEAMQMANRPQG